MLEKLFLTLYCLFCKLIYNNIQFFINIKLVQGLLNFFLGLHVHQASFHFLLDDPFDFLLDLPGNQSAPASTFWFVVGCLLAGAGRGGHGSFRARGKRSGGGPGSALRQWVRQRAAACRGPAVLQGHGRAGRQIAAALPAPQDGRMVPARCDALPRLDQGHEFPPGIRRQQIPLNAWPCVL